MFIFLTAKAKTKTITNCFIHRLVLVSFNIVQYGCFSEEIYIHFNNNFSHNTHIKFHKNLEKNMIIIKYTVIRINLWNMCSQFTMKLIQQFVFCRNNYYFVEIVINQLDPRLADIHEMNQNQNKIWILEFDWFIKKIAANETK